MGVSCSRVGHTCNMSRVSCSRVGHTCNMSRVSCSRVGHTQVGPRPTLLQTLWDAGLLPPASTGKLRALEFRVRDGVEG